VLERGAKRPLGQHRLAEALEDLGQRPGGVPSGDRNGPFEELEGLERLLSCRHRVSEVKLQPGLLGAENAQI
jgi:hypothetical protein